MKLELIAQVLNDNRYEQGGWYVTKRGNFKQGGTGLRLNPFVAEAIAQKYLRQVDGCDESNLSEPVEFRRKHLSTLGEPLDFDSESVKLRLQSLSRIFDGSQHPWPGIYRDGAEWLLQLAYSLIEQNEQARDATNRNDVRGWRGG